MKNKLLILMLCCFTAVLCLSTLSGCAAYSLDDVFAKIEKMQCAEVNMVFRLVYTGQRYYIGTISLYCDAKKPDDIFIHMLTDINNDPQDFYITNDYIYVCDDNELIGMLSTDIEDYENHETARGKNGIRFHN
jgi:outer membrane lipoprotein-sorting protein